VTGAPDGKNGDSKQREFHAPIINGNSRTSNPENVTQAFGIIIM
jgi:hypothetical protein